MISACGIGIGGKMKLAIVDVVYFVGSETVGGYRDEDLLSL